VSASRTERAFSRSARRIVPAQRVDQDARFTLPVAALDAFGEGTRALALAIAESPAFSIAGGGDTLAAIAKYGVQDRIGYISTGGGAFLEFLEGKKLPAVEILEKRAVA